ncbi:hypothetical protein MMC11_000573 [Xylographa trunciseda]|nr:hypothetical protein [Xylographa trunciseda]
MSLLISNGIDRPQREVRPANYDQLRDRLAKRRDSLSPSRFSEFDYKNFLAAIDNAHDEGQVMTDVFSVVKGSKVCPSTANRPCNNWMPLISDALVTPQPDFYYGERQKPQDADLRKALDGLIVPSRSSEAPFLPNFLVEVKAPGASAEIARRQAVYDGALAARAMHHLQAYGAEEAYDENAYAFTSTYIDGKLEIFAHHMTPSDQPGKQPSHHTVSIGRWMLDDDIHAFFRGITAFRNLRDLAQGFRESFIAGANSRMDLLTPEVRDQKIAQASTRMKEISDRNIAVESFPAAAQSPLTNTRGVQTPLEQDGDTTNEAVVFPAGRAETRATGRTELLKKALTKGKHDHQLKLTKGPKGRKKPGKKPLKG